MSRRSKAMIALAAAALLVAWILRSSRGTSAADQGAGPEGAPTAASAPGSPAATALRWKLLGSVKCERVIRSVGEAEGSRGISVEYDTNPEQRLVLQIDAKAEAGEWMLRVDDGKHTPNWLPLGDYSASRVTGSEHYRFMIYSDDRRAAIEIRDVTIRPAEDADDGLPLVWPQEGRLVEQDRQRRAARLAGEWLALLGLREDEGVIAKARAITNFVYQRSNAKISPEPTFSHFGGAREWGTATAPTVDGLCGTFATAVLDLCDKLGIAARRVSLATKQFAEGNAIGDTHELVEVFEPSMGNWVLFDPSFNLTFEADGRLLGLRDLLRAAAEGRNWKAVPIGTLRPGRTVGDYYLPYEDLLWMGSAPAVSGLGDLGSAFRSEGPTFQEISRTKYPEPVAP